MSNTMADPFGFDQNRQDSPTSEDYLGQLVPIAFSAQPALPVPGRGAAGVSEAPVSPGGMGGPTPGPVADPSAGGGFGDVASQVLPNEEAASPGSPPGGSSVPSPVSGPLSPTARNALSVASAFTPTIGVPFAGLIGSLISAAGFPTFGAFVQAFSLDPATVMKTVDTVAVKLGVPNVLNPAFSTTTLGELNLDANQLTSILGPMGNAVELDPQGQPMVTPDMTIGQLYGMSNQEQPVAGGATPGDPVGTVAAAMGYNDVAGMPPGLAATIGNLAALGYTTASITAAMQGNTNFGEGAAPGGAAGPSAGVSSDVGQEAP